MTGRLRRTTIALLVVASAVAAGCADGDGDAGEAGPTTRPGSTATAAPSTTGLPARPDL